MSPKEVAIPSTLRLLQLKILHRTYYTRDLLHKIGRADNSLCVRHCGTEGTLWHTIWDCPQIATYWASVMRTMSQVTNVHVSPTAKCCLLNIWEPTDLNHADQDWVILGMTLAKRNIAQRWGAEQPPTPQQWCRDMDHTMVTEKSVYIHRGCPAKWTHIWNKWNHYRRNICDPPPNRTVLRQQ